MNYINGHKSTRLALPLLLLFFTIYAFPIQGVAQKVDSATTQQPAISSQNQNADTDEEFNVFLFGIFFGAMMLCVAAAFIASIFALTVILFLLVFVAAGILTVSALSAWYKQSIKAGLRTGIYITASLAGALFGVAASYFADLIFDWSDSVAAIWLVGILSGIVAGITGAAVAIWLAGKIWQASLGWLQTKKYID